MGNVQEGHSGHNSEAQGSAATSPASGPHPSAGSEQTGQAGPARATRDEDAAAGQAEGLRQVVTF